MDAIISSNKLKPVLEYLVSLSRCAAHCNVPRFVARRWNNWWYELKAAYCLTNTLRHFTALQGEEEQRIFSTTWVKLQLVILEQIMLFIRRHSSYQPSPTVILLQTTLLSGCFFFHSKWSIRFTRRTCTLLFKNILNYILFSLKLASSQRNQVSWTKGAHFLKKVYFWTFAHRIKTGQRRIM